MSANYYFQHFQNIPVYRIILKQITILGSKTPNSSVPPYTMQRLLQFLELHQSRRSAEDIVRVVFVTAIHIKKKKTHRCAAIYFSFAQIMSRLVSRCGFSPSCGVRRFNVASFACCCFQLLNIRSLRYLGSSYFLGFTI